MFYSTASQKDRFRNKATSVQEVRRITRFTTGIWWEDVASDFPGKGAWQGAACCSSASWKEQDKFYSIFKWPTFKAKYPSFCTYAWRQRAFQLTHGIRFRGESTWLSYRNFTSVESAGCNGIMAKMVSPQTSIVNNWPETSPSGKHIADPEPPGERLNPIINPVACNFVFCNSKWHIKPLWWVTGEEKNLKRFSSECFWCKKQILFFSKHYK